jgi:hypothetical protein
MLCAGRCQYGHAYVVMVAGVVLAAWQVMGLAMRGMKVAMVNFGHHCPGAMRDGLDGRRGSQG